MQGNAARDHVENQSDVNKQVMHVREEVELEHRSGQMDGGEELMGWESPQESQDVVSGSLELLSIGLKSMEDQRRPVPLVGPGSPRQRAIAKAVRQARHPGDMWYGSLRLYGVRLGEQGGRLLAAALQSWGAQYGAKPQELRQLSLGGCLLTEAGLLPIVAALHRFSGLAQLWLFDNPLLGDSAIAALAGALPSTLQVLTIDRTGCGDAGLRAVCAALPRSPSITQLDCAHNPAITTAGWSVLAQTVPAMAEITTLRADGGLLSAEAAAQQLSEAACLQTLWLSGSGITDSGASRLAAALPQYGALRFICIEYRDVPGAGDPGDGEPPPRLHRLSAETCAALAEAAQRSDARPRGGLIFRVSATVAPLEGAVDDSPLHR
eukprot:COSAG06_NODE_1598_length_8970_cov_9.246280_1_plen_379_part_00